VGLARAGRSLDHRGCVGAQHLEDAPLFGVALEREQRIRVIEQTRPRSLRKPLLLLLTLERDGQLSQAERCRGAGFLQVGGESAVELDEPAAGARS
jgi:hypothetical protein